MPVLTACLSVRVSTGGRAIDSLASYLPRDPSLLTFVRLQHLLCSPPKAGSARGNCERSPSEERWLFSFLFFLYFSTAKNQGKGHQEKKERERERLSYSRGLGMQVQVLSYRCPGRVTEARPEALQLTASHVVTLM